MRRVLSLGILYLIVPSITLSFPLISETSADENGLEESVEVAAESLKIFKRGWILRNNRSFGRYYPCIGMSLPVFYEKLQHR